MNSEPGRVCLGLQNCSGSEKVGAEEDAEVDATEVEEEVVVRAQDETKVDEVAEGGIEEAEIGIEAFLDNGIHEGFEV